MRHQSHALLLLCLGIFICRPAIGSCDEPAETAEELSPALQVKNIRRAYYDGNHNAFTDLCRFKDRYYLTFRSCPDGHMVHPTSSIVVLTSTDAKTWQKVNQFSVPRRDVRDPHFLEFRGRLFIYTGTWYCGDASPKTRDLNQHLGFCSFSDDGRNWSEPTMLEGTYGHYIWRAAQSSDKAFLCGRRKHRFSDESGSNREIIESAMLESDDGLVWKTRSLFQESWGDETAFLVEDDGSILAVARRGSTPAEICRSSPPYAEWRRQPLDRYIGGPMLAKWGNRYIVGGRNNTSEGPRTVLCLLSGENTLNTIAELPSDGDNSYTGFVALDEQNALLSWYSSHEQDSAGKTITAIYLADLQLE
ncbi:MAG: exo-alpha-sialidase [Planctomycetaceae bacterium]|nr:exo-alpha-sialidase [Planctomycetaceae bacterium]